MRRLILALAATVLVMLPASASATVTMTGFSVTPSSKAGGGHPDVTIVQEFAYDNTTDSVKDAFVRLQPGLLGNPQNAAMCTQAQFTADSCAADSTVASVEVDATARPLVGLPVDLTSQGTVYNLRPTGDEPARLGIVVRPTVVGLPLEKIFLQSAVYVRPGADGYGLESTFADQPSSSGGIAIQITRVALTLNGKASKGSFMRMPTSCAEGVSVSRANSWEAQSSFSQKDFRMTPTGCSALTFSPKAQGSLGAPGITDRLDFAPLSTTLLFDPEEAALKRAEVTLPGAVGPNIAGANRACTREGSDAGNCPESSRVGTAIIDSPLQAAPVRGPVYVAFNTSATLPGLIVMLPAPVSVRLDGLVDATSLGTRNTFASNPDLPVRSFTLEFEGNRPDSILQLAQDLCSNSADTTMDVKLIAHNGKESHFKQDLATPGCDPKASISVRRVRRRATLVARMKATRDGPGVKAFTLKLPKRLPSGKSRPFVLVDGKRVKPVSRRRRATFQFPEPVRAATVVWRGLRPSRKLKRMTLIRLAMVDTRDKTTSLRRHVRVRGKIPKRRR